MRALIIDDEEGIRDLISDILESIQVTCVTAENCKEGLDILLDLGEKGEKFDVVFVDWKTPVMNGMEFTHAVREKPDLKDLPLLMVTGKTDMGDVEEALGQGVSEYLMKPFTPDMVKNKMELLGFEIPS